MKLKLFGILIFFFLLISFLQFVSSQEISFNYPNEVCVNEEFTANLNLINFSSGIYDVKIDITDLASGIRISKIYNVTKWISTTYYLNDAISNTETKDFLLNIFQDFNSASIVVKIRASPTSTPISFSGYNISKKSSCSSQTNQTNPTINNTIITDNSTNNSTLQNSSEILASEADYSLGGRISISPNKTPQKIDLNSISLNTKTIKTVKSSDLENKTKGKYAIYLLITFCVLLLFLFLLRKKKYTKNEFN
jgi:hypothetical protein